MRYDGRYEKTLRQQTIEVNHRKFVGGSATITRGDTIVTSTAKWRKNDSLQAETYCLTVHYLGSAVSDDRTIATRQQHLTAMMNQILAASLKEWTAHDELVLEVIIQQDDGSVFSSAVNSLYLALQQLIDQSAMQTKDTQQHSMLPFAACTIAQLENETMILDPDYHEETQLSVMADVVVDQTGEFLGIFIDNCGQPYSINFLNEVVVVGKSKAEEALIELQQALYTQISIDQPEKTIVIATGNEGKAREFASLFGQAGYRIKTLKDFPELPDVAETGHTFAENACLKAETIANILQMPVLADDSGLTVDVLNGLPGVYSARFAGPQKSDAANNAKLLHELTDVPDEQRTAQFHCTLAFAAPKKATLLVEAQWSGHIGRIPRGENGFGYDSLFFVEELAKTAAELSPAEKNQMSHRGQAMKKLSEQWIDWLEGEDNV